MGRYYNKSRDAPDSLFPNPAGTGFEKKRRNPAEPEPEPDLAHS